MIYKYELEINNNTYNIGLNINGADTTIKTPLCSTSYKSASGEATVQLIGTRNSDNYKNVLQAILNARSNINPYDIALTIKEDTENEDVVFRGYLDDTNFTIETKILPEKLTLSARDKTILLDEQIKFNPIYKNKTRTEIVSSLLTLLGQQTGITVSLLSSDLTDTTTDSIVSDWVAIEEDKKTYRQRIDTLLMEAPGCVLWYDPKYDGYRIKQLPKEFNSANSIRKVKYNVTNKLQTTNGVYTYDGILVKYPTVSRRENQNVFSDNISRSIDEQTQKVIGEDVLAGEYYPKDGDVIATYQPYSVEGLDRAYITQESRKKNDDISLLYVENPSYDIAVDPSGALEEVDTVLPTVGYPGEVTYYPRKAWILLQNKTQTKANISLFSIKGTAVYKSKINKMTLPLACSKPEEYETETLFADGDTDTKIKEFASWYLNAKKYSCTTSTWEETEDRVNVDNPFSKLGDIVYVSHSTNTETSINIPHIVVQIENISHTEYGRIRKHKVTAISLNGYSTYTNIKRETSQSNGDINNNKILNITTYYGSSASEDTEPTNWTTDRTTVQFDNTLPYLWQYIKYTYSNNTESTTSKNIIDVYQNVEVSVPKYLGMVTDAQQLATVTSDAHEGDGILIGANITGYKTGFPYIFKNGSWVEQEEINADNASMLWVMIENASSISNSAFSWFTNLVASTASIKNLFSQYIIMDEDGIIQSNNYTEDSNGTPTNGYKLSSRDGKIKGVDVEIIGLQAKEATIYGDIINDNLTTVTGGGQTASITYSQNINTPYYQVKELYDEFVEALFESGRTTGTRYHILQNSTLDIYWIPSKSVYSFKPNGKEYAVFDDIPNGVPHEVAGDLLHHACFVFYEDNEVNVFVTKADNVSSIHLEATSSATPVDISSWGLDSYYMFSLNDFSGLSNIQNNKNYISTGTLTYDGVNYTISQIKKTDNAFIITTANGTTFTFKNGSYYHSITISNLTVQIGLSNGIITGSIYTNANRNTIGTEDEPFHIIYANNVYGAVFN